MPLKTKMVTSSPPLHAEFRGSPATFETKMSLKTDVKKPKTKRCGYATSHAHAKPKKGSVRAAPTRHVQRVTDNRGRTSETKTDAAARVLGEYGRHITTPHQRSTRHMG